MPNEKNAFDLNQFEKRILHRISFSRQIFILLVSIAPYLFLFYFFSFLAHWILLDLLPPFVRFMQYKEEIMKKKKTIAVGILSLDWLRYSFVFFLLSIFLDHWNAYSVTFPICYAKWNKNVLIRFYRYHLYNPFDVEIMKYKKKEFHILNLLKLRIVTDSDL